MARSIFEPDQTREALRSALSGAADSGDEPPTPPNFYVPIGHIKAIDPSYPLVVGGRGTGKSVWWNALRSPPHRDTIALALEDLEKQSFGRFAVQTQLLRSGKIVAGYGESPERLDPSLPTRGTFSELLKAGAEPETIWRAIVAVLTWGAEPGSPLASYDSWSARVAWIAQHSSVVDQLFVDYDRALEKRGDFTLLVFDSIDRSANDWVQLRAITRGLLQSVLYFRNYRGFRLKTFLRPDIVADPAVFAFPDSSKLRQNTINLHWDPRDLYTLIWQRLGNDPTFGAWFRISSHRHDNRLRWNETDQKVFTVPLLLRNDPAVQEALLHEITGPRVSRSKPYKWLIQELKDSNEQVSPRSLINALRIAAEVPEEAGSTFAISPKALEHGLREAAALRTDEIAEDFPWIGLAIKSLRDVVTPVAFAEVKKLWRKKDVIKKIEEDCKAGQLLPRRLPQGEDGLRMDLADIGLFIDRDDGRIDVPEVARIGFGLRRRGGVKPSKAKS